MKNVLPWGSKKAPDSLIEKKMKEFDDNVMMVCWTHSHFEVGRV
jgi:hypothetical protein